MALIAGAVVGAVTAVAGAASNARSAAKKRGAGVAAMQARATNAEVNALFAGVKKGGIAQMMMSLSQGPAPRGVPPWMSGQA